MAVLRSYTKKLPFKTVKLVTGTQALGSGLEISIPTFNCSITIPLSIILH